MDRALLDQARQRLHKDERAMETMLHDLQATQRKLADDLAKAVEARSEAEQAEQRVKAQLAHLEETEREAQRGLKRKLSEQFSRARAEVQATVDAVKGEQKLMKAKAAKQRLFELEARTRAEMAPAVYADPARRVGSGRSGRISGLASPARSSKRHKGKKRVRVKVGMEKCSPQWRISLVSHETCCTAEASAIVIEPQPVHVRRWAGAR